MIFCYEATIRVFFLLCLWYTFSHTWYKAVAWLMCAKLGHELLQLESEINLGKTFLQQLLTVTLT